MKARSRKVAAPSRAGERLAALRRRGRATRHLQRLLLKRAYPRMEMALMVGLTGLAGFLASALLLHLGVRSMAVRYPIALLASYAVFLLLLRAWVARQVRRDGSSLQVWDVLDLPSTGKRIATDPVAPGFGGGRFGGGGTGGSFAIAEPPGMPVSYAAEGTGETVIRAGGRGVREGISSVADDAVGAVDDGWPLVLVLCLLASILLAATFIVWIAPALLAEALLDALIVSGLLRRMKGVEPRHWAVGVVRRTWLLIVCLAMVLSATGWLMERAVPGAASVGDVLRPSLPSA